MALKKSFSKDKKTCDVTFVVSAEAAQGAKTITLAGDWNSWSSTETKLVQKKDGSFSVKVTLETGKEYQFRYLLDGSRWENDWEADKYIPAPFSNTDNSVVVCIPSEKEVKPVAAAAEKVLPKPRKACKKSK